MGPTYVQLSIEDRCRIASLQEQGRSIRQIAAALDRAPSSIAREIKRNAGCKVGYRPAYAHEQTRARPWKGSKLERDENLRRRLRPTTPPPESASTSEPPPSYSSSSCCTSNVN